MSAALLLSPAWTQAQRQDARRLAVQRFATACFDAFEQRDWRAGLSCIDATELRGLADSYIAERVAPSYLQVPRELTLGLRADVSKTELAAMPALELLDGALRGALDLASSNGYHIDRLRFSVAKAEHRVQEVYAVQLRVAVVIGGIEPIRLRARYEVLAHDEVGGIRLRIPAAVYDILRLKRTT